MAGPNSTAGSPDGADLVDGADGRGWLSLHIHHTADTDGLLTGCVGPLTRRLRARGLVERSFFLRYWVEGPHVRWRLLPACGVSGPVVRATVCREVAAFLRDAATPPDGPAVPDPDVRRARYVAEYGRAAWDRTYGNRGMPVQPDNSYRWVPYRPEVDRYGGPAGLVLAEEHFARSSDVVVQLLADQPAPAARLGRSAYLTLALGRGLLGDRGHTLTFLQAYRDFWHGWVGTDDPAGDGTTRGSGPLRQRLRDLADALDAPSRAPEPTSVPDADDADGRPMDAGSWPRHCVELGARVAELFEDGRLTVADAAGRPADLPTTRRALLHSYVHMTNNRLGLSVLQEAYVAQLLISALAPADPG